MPIISLPEQNREITVSLGSNLLDMLKQNGVYPDAPCGGNGKCGKCKVSVDGREVLSCQTTVDRDMTVVLPRLDGLQILQEGIASKQNVAPLQEGYLLAFDIGTTTVAGYLLDGKTWKVLRLVLRWWMPFRC